MQNFTKLPRNVKRLEARLLETNLDEYTKLGYREVLIALMYLASVDKIRRWEADYLAATVLSWCELEKAGDHDCHLSAMDGCLRRQAVKEYLHSYL